MPRTKRLQPIVSPCLNVCKIKNNICVGCFRTLEEISVWGSVSDEKRTEIMESLKKRSSQKAENR